MDKITNMLGGVGGGSAAGGPKKLSEEDLEFLAQNTASDR